MCSRNGVAAWRCSIPCVKAGAVAIKCALSKREKLVKIEQEGHCPSVVRSFGGREFLRGPRDPALRGYLQSRIPGLILCRSVHKGVHLSA